MSFPQTNRGFLRVVQSNPGHPAGKCVAEIDERHDRIALILPFRDAMAARSKLRELASIKDDEMLLMGESVGGAVMIQLAADSAPRGLILQSTFSSLRDIADFHFPKLSWLVPRSKLDSVTKIARFTGPLLQSHGNTVVLTFQRDVVTALLVGVPIASMALPFITFQTCHLLAIPIFFSLASAGAFYCYCWPSVICPIDLPPTAQNLYVTNDLIRTHVEVRFDATVDECIATAKLLHEEACELEGVTHPPMTIDRIQGIVPPEMQWHAGKKWWFDINQIQRGLYYPGGGPWYPALWVDTERGVFYLCQM